ncbi:MAG: SpoIIE family protein phosphatase [Bacteroidaceae bacterium]|nr:SpoIIE family protein phosphatase [Bacteroidaceae bacterium]
MKQKTEERPTRYNRSFARRLTRWMLLVLFVMMSALGYFIYEMSKSIITEFSAGNFHSVMQASAGFFSNEMADVSQAVRNNLHEVEQHAGEPAQLQQTFERIVRLNPNIMKCDITYVSDSAGIDRLREVIAADSACWSVPFFQDSSQVGTPVVAYQQPVHDGQGRVVAVMSALLSLDFMATQDERLDSLFRQQTGIISVTNQGDSKSYVLMRDGTYLSHPRRWPILRANFYAHIRDIDKPGTASEVIGQMRQGECSQSERAKPLLVNRTRSYLFYVPIEDSDWNLAVSVPAISLDLFGIVVGIFMLLAMLNVLIVTFFVCRLTIRRVANPLKELAATADKVASGRFDTPLPAIRSRDEVHLLRDSFENMQHSLTAYVDQLQRATAAKASMESELKIAHDIQMSMLPKDFPAFPERHDVDVYGSVMPAKAVGGDLYDFFIRDERLFFCIGDVSGKGVPASLLMAVTRYLFRNIAAYTQEPAQIAVALNDAVSSNNDAGMFVTLFLAVLDLRTGSLSYSNAGHNPPLLVGDGGVSPLACDANIPVGVMAGFSFTAQHVQLRRGDTVFLYTDGLSEAENVSQQQFGIERVQQVARNAANQPQRLVDAMTAAVRLFVGQAEQSDDLTMLVVKYTP